MPATDANFAGRLIHVCPDATVGALAAAAANRCGLACARFDNAFDACLELLRRGASRTILLVALDSLAKVELPLLTWAPARWPDIAVWAHGSTSRLNGHLAQARVKLVSLSHLAELLASQAGLATTAADPAAAPRASIPQPTGPLSEPENVVPSEPEIIRELAMDLGPPPAGATEQDELLDVLPGPEQPPLPVNPALNFDAGLASSPEVVNKEPIADRSGNTLASSQNEAPPPAPALRLHAPDSTDRRAVVSAEELAALLGPEDGHGG